MANRSLQRSRPVGVTADAAAIGIIAAVLGVCIYRAVHLSLTIDEAITYNIFVCQPWRWMMTMYSTNHHVLASIIAKAFISVFGLSEWTLRMPALIGAAIFLWYVYRLARLLLGRSWPMVLAVAAAVLSPYTIDYLSLARGYALAMGLFTWGLFRLTGSVNAFGMVGPAQPNLRGHLRTGALFGLAIAAHLTYAVPIVLAVAIFGLIEALSRSERRVRSASLLVGAVMMPCVLVATLLLAGPLGPWATRNFNNFVTGIHCLTDTYRAFITANFDHDRLTLAPLTGEAVMAASAAIALLLLISVGLILVLVRRGWSGGRFDRLSIRQLRWLALAAILIGCIVVSLLGPAITGSQFPAARQLTYWIMMLAIISAGAASMLWRQGGPANRIAGGAVAALLVCGVVRFAGQFDTRAYHGLQFDASTRQMLDRVAATRQSRDHPLFRSDRPVRIGGDQLLGQTSNLYRRIRRWNWLGEYQSIPSDDLHADACADLDFLLLGFNREVRASDLGFQVIYADEFGNRLARRVNSDELASARGAVGGGEQ